MDKQEILHELRKQFEETKKKLGFKATYNEINSIFSIESRTLSEGYVSPKLSRKIIEIIINTFQDWINELYAWIYPAPMDIIHTNESKKISLEERKEIFEMVSRIMYLVRKNRRIAFGGLIKKEEANFFDELMDFYKKYFNPFMLRYNEKFEKLWKDEFMDERIE